MKKIHLFLLSFCIIALSALADSQNPTPTQPPTPTIVKITLSKKSDNKSLRAPSNNPNNFVEGYYDTDGILYLYPNIESMWELTISSNQGIQTYYTTSDELFIGINIGYIPSFSIILTNSDGAIFTGEFTLNY